MKKDEYRELFSDAYEGVLEEGLRAAFDARLLADDELRAEYERFGSVRRSLDAMAKEEAPVPTYLSARILDRLETAPAWGGLPAFLRALPYAGLAAAAIVGGVWTITRPGGDVAPAGMLASGRPGTLEIAPSAKGARIALSPDRATEVEIASAPEGIALQRYRLGEAPLRAELTNPNRGAAAFRIGIAGRPPVHVSLPGSEPKPAFPTIGSGDLLGLTKVLARAYGLVVVLRGPEPNAPAKWALSGNDAVADANRSLAGTGLAARRTNGTVEIAAAPR